MPRRGLSWCAKGQTEEDYFNFLNRELRAEPVKILARRDKPEPKEILDLAEKYLNGDSRAGIEPAEGDDEVWAVFDFDQRKGLRSLIDCADKKLHIAVSNPAFEIWLIWHFEDCMRTNFTQAQALKELEHHWYGYAKGLSKNDWEDLLKHKQEALERAKHADEIHEHDGRKFPDNCPSSGVWNLIEDIGAVCSRKSR
ncbi:MAG: RloB domain-containing protein [Bifidobacterium sp.]|nr:RloB domain-containing protein [Bifidobacterium sp.]